MGLDMYLLGEKSFFPKVAIEDGYKVESHILELGYWRKHPDLHGFIVETFADGIDNCRQIELSVNNIKQIIQAIKDRVLPKTTGFFFGESDSSMDERSIEILEKAIAWVEDEKEEFRSIHYRASW